MSRTMTRARRPASQRSPAYSPGNGRDQTVVKAAEAPARPHLHAPAPEAARASARLAREAVLAAEKVGQEALFARFLGGELTPTRAQAEALSADRLRRLCKARGWAGYSGLKKGELAEHVASGGAKFAPVGRSGPRSEELRAECKVRREDAKAKGSVAYKGYSSLNKAGLAFLLENAGAKPGLKDGTFKVGTVAWLQQVARETGLKGFSGLKKAELVERLLAGGAPGAGELVQAAIEAGELEVALPLLRKLGVTP